MMNLTPTEQERLTIFQAAEFARRHKALGVKLSHPEAVALIADEMLLAARRDMPYAEIVDMAGRLLTTDDVLPGVAAMISLVSVEGNFDEGTKMIVVFNPVGPGTQPLADDEIPGEIITAPVIDNQQVYAATLEGTLSCFKQDNGELLWAEKAFTAQ